MMPTFTNLDIVDQGLVLASMLFAIGVAGILTRRNIIFILLSVEIMLNAVGLAFIAAGSRFGQADGQVMFLFILTVAAAEVAVGLAMVLQFYRRFKGLDITSANWLRG
jgi:NADH-quinone oxidoreductase subunit K